ncbi:MAG TPA: hypothetical protein VMI10_07905 [Terriglobales bacterium]|nr:hypothetical protein [Terriglobales bacterium]
MRAESKTAHLWAVNVLIVLGVLAVLCGARASAQSGAWLTHSHDEQHTALSEVQSQSLSKIHWKTPVDLFPPQGEIFIHYGSPLVTASNTVIVPVKTGNNSFRVQAMNGATGKKIWQLNTGWQAPGATFVPGLGATISGSTLYIPDIAGRVIARPNPDLKKQPSTKLYFYGVKNFKKNQAAYKANIQINTPLTTDSAGNLFFGFLALGPTPLNLQGGLARIGTDGTGTWVSAASLSGDSSVFEVSMSAAPALSLDGSILYVAVDNGDYGYLLALNSSTLAVINKVLLKDPSSGLTAIIFDASSASPTVGPDGDVYFGVLENPFPNHNDRGWLLHFNADLTQTKIPGSFGWDDTASIVPSSMVPSYKGTSTYLLMTKYNNYCGVGNGNGQNKIAILDPNATEHDPIIPNTLVMNEVLTHLGVTPDQDCPGGVREWCINTAAVDPFSKSVLANSEDGKLYRWDMTTNTFTEVITLSSGVGEAYTPTVIGADGMAYAINQAVLDAIGK